MTHRYYFQGANGHGHVRLKKKQKKKTCTSPFKIIFFLSSYSTKNKIQIPSPQLRKDVIYSLPSVWISLKFLLQNTGLVFYIYVTNYHKFTIESSIFLLTHSFCRSEVLVWHNQVHSSGPCKAESEVLAGAVFSCGPQASHLSCWQSLVLWL